MFRKSENILFANQMHYVHTLFNAYINLFIFNLDRIYQRREGRVWAKGREKRSFLSRSQITPTGTIKSFTWCQRRTAPKNSTRLKITCAARKVSSLLASLTTRLRLHGSAIRILTWLTTRRTSNPRFAGWSSAYARNWASTLVIGCALAAARSSSSSWHRYRQTTISHPFRTSTSCTIIFRVTIPRCRHVYANVVRKVSRHDRAFRAWRFPKSSLLIYC